MTSFSVEYAALAFQHITSTQSAAAFVDVLESDGNQTVIIVQKNTFLCFRTVLIFVKFIFWFYLVYFKIFFFNINPFDLIINHC